jgi:hypothetical protein
VTSRRSKSKSNLHITVDFRFRGGGIQINHPLQQVVILPFVIRESTITFICLTAEDAIRRLAIHDRAKHHTSNARVEVGRHKQSRFVQWWQECQKNGAKACSGVGRRALPLTTGLSSRCVEIQHKYRESQSHFVYVWGVVEWSFF